MSHVHTNSVQGIITALQSDGSATAWPTPRAAAHQGSTGISNSVSEAASKTKTMWLTNLGKAMPAQASTPNNVPWNISSFPSGYNLFSHTNNAGPQGKLRTDHYLYGRYMDVTSPRTSARVYRTPKEFAPHFWWLCNSQRMECKCKHCVVERRQATKKRTYGIGGIIARRRYRRANLTVTNAFVNSEHEEEEDEDEERDELHGDA